MKAHRKIGPYTLVFFVLLWSTMSFLVQTTRADEDDDHRGDDDTPFTLASLRGTYGAHVIAARGGAGVSAIGMFTFDGAGNFSGRTIWNIEGDIFDFTVQGTYTVSSDGFFDLTAEGGPLQTLIGVITRSRTIKRRHNTRRVALEASIISPALGPGGNVLTIVIARRSSG